MFTPRDNTQLVLASFLRMAFDLFEKGYMQRTSMELIVDAVELAMEEGELSPLIWTEAELKLFSSVAESRESGSTSQDV